MQQKFKSNGSNAKFYFHVDISLNKTSCLVGVTNMFHAKCNHVDIPGILFISVFNLTVQEHGAVTTVWGRGSKNDNPSCSWSLPYILDKDCDENNMNVENTIEVNIIVSNGYNWMNYLAGQIFYIPLRK